MLYEQYLVTRAELVDVKRAGDVQKRYICEMVNAKGHKIGFTLLLDGCVGAPDYRAKYETVAPFIEVGKLLHCEFALRWHDPYFQLCLSGIMKCRARKWDNEGAEISPEDFFNSRRGYWATALAYGEWARFPGLINLEGEAFLPTRFDHKSYPVFSSEPLSESPSGALVWKKK